MSRSAWAGAAHTLEATYEIPYIAHVPLEPRTAIAEWDDAGKLTVWAGTQRPFGVRGELAQAFQLPEDARARDLPGHGIGVRRQALRRACGGSGAAREGGEASGEAGVDARGRIHVGILPARWRDQREERDRCERPPRRVVVRQLQLGQFRHPHAVRRAQSAHRVPSVEFAAEAGLVSRAGGDRESLRARDAHGRNRAGDGHRRGGVPSAQSEG